MGQFDKGGWDSLIGGWESVIGMMERLDRDDGATWVVGTGARYGGREEKTIKIHKRASSQFEMVWN